MEWKGGGKGICLFIFKLDIFSFLPMPVVIFCVKSVLWFEQSAEPYMLTKWLFISHISDVGAIFLHLKLYKISGYV